MAINSKNVGFLSHKELAAAYNVHPWTFSKYLKKAVPLLYAIKNLGKRGNKRYSPAEQKIIYDKLGEPVN